MSSNIELRNLREGRAALERARALGEIRELKRIGDLASAAKRFAEAQGLSEDAKRYAAEMELDAKRCLGEVLAEQKKHPGGRPAKTGTSDVPVSSPPTLRELGVTKHQSEDAQKLAAIPDDDYEAFKSSARSDTLNVKRALRVAREKDAERRRDEVAEVAVLPRGVEVRHGDFREVLTDVGADAIITDPPYPAEYLDLYDDLSAFTAEALKPNGILAVMVGQTHLPEYIRRLSTHLEYRWCGAYLTDGPATRIHGRAVGTKWKPILIFGGNAFITQDVFRSDADDKRHHHWGQSEAGIADLIERLTKPGDLVVDPFLGGGTTAIVCRDLGRKFIGCDLDADAVQTTLARLAA